MVTFRYITILFSLFLTIDALAQKPYVEIIVEQCEVEVGEQFNVIVKSNVSGEINIEFPDEFEQGFNVMNRMEQDYDGNTGESVQYFYHGRSGSLIKEGKFTIGPAFVKKGNHVYKSNKVKVRATTDGPSEQKLEEHLLRKPAYGKIEISKNKVYAGEAFVVNSKIIARFKPSHYDSYKSYKFKPSVDLHELNKDKPPMMEAKQFAGQIRYIFEHDNQLVFANSAGKFNIDPFTMTLQAGFDGYEVRSRKNSIVVMPLPKGAPKTFTGGVGDFDISNAVDKKKVKQGDIVTLTLTISGYGNLHDISKPKIDLGHHFKLYGDPKIEEQFVFTKKGAEGKILIIYNLQAIQDGPAVFPTMEMSYFDPLQEEYKTVFTKPPSVTVERNPDFIVQNKTTSDKKELTIDRFTEKDKEVEAEGFFSGSTAAWIGVSAPLCAAFIFLLFKRRKDDDKTRTKATTVISDSIVNEGPRINTDELISGLQILAEDGNHLTFFTQLSKDLQVATSQAAKNDISWVLTKDETIQFFKDKQFSPEFQATFFELQQTCELCRYGCQKPENNLTIYVEKVKSIFTTLES